MNRITILLVFFMTCSAYGICQSSLYGIQLPALNEKDTIRLSDYQGKKILLVNTACLSPASSQFAGLSELYAKFKDSGLVIIAFPSNSFGYETGTNSEIQQFISDRFTLGFPVTSKSEVSGAGANAVYKWIASKEQNTVMNGKVKADFNKFLINAQGKIVGFFSDQVMPMDEILISTIRKN